MSKVTQLPVTPAAALTPYEQLVEDRRQLAHRLADLDAELHMVQHGGAVRSAPLISFAEAGKRIGLDGEALRRRATRAKLSFVRKISHKKVMVDPVSFERWIATRRPS